jgi:hypothetical protein
MSVRAFGRLSGNRPGYVTRRTGSGNPAEAPRPERTVLELADAARAAGGVGREALQVRLEVVSELVEELCTSHSGGPPSVVALRISARLSLSRINGR